jgi:predicted PurR-regulated permease PerM
VLLSAAAFVVAVAGMRAAADILVPFLLAVFIAILCSEPMGLLRRLGVPRWIAVTVVVLGVLGLGAAVTTLLGTSLIDFTRTLPLYQQRLESETEALLGWLRGLGLDVSGDLLLSYFELGRILQLVGGILTGLRGLVTDAFLIILTMIFILIEMSSFPAKLGAALGEADASEASGAFSDFVVDVRKYVGLKTLVSLGTGALVAAWLAFLGVDYSLLWGVVAFLLNYVPTIGSWIAALPAVLFAFLQLGPGAGLAAALGYLVVNTLMGNVVEPRVMGRGMGLSTLVVFLSLIFWGWVLGPIGMLLSVPLTVILKRALELQDSTRWIGILLGPAMPAGTPVALPVTEEASAG